MYKEKIVDINIRIRAKQVRIKEYFYKINKIEESILRSKIQIESLQFKEKNRKHITITGIEFHNEEDYEVLRMLTAKNKKFKYIGQILNTFKFDYAILPIVIVDEHNNRGVTIIKTVNRTQLKDLDVYYSN